MNNGLGGGLVLAMGMAAQAVAAPEVMPEQLQQLDATVERVREQFDVPGVAVAVVKDGKVILQRGWGVRELGKPAPVQADTLFAIASNTKAFTATALNLLAEDGKLKMDDRVIDHLPSFRMSDAYVTGEMRIADLLSHRSGLGLGAGDLLFWPATTYSNAEVVARLAKVPLKGGFRDRYAYDNILYAVAQRVIETVSGQSFDTFLQQRIFDRVGMAGTRYNADHLLPGDKAATGHAKFDFTDLRPVPPLTWSNAAGAGGLYSSVQDMAKWMTVQLAEGRLADGTPLFSEKTQQQMWQMQIPQAVPRPTVPELEAARPNFAGYGQGWSLSDYRGQKLVWHTGGWPGQVSRLTLVPAQELGVVVLTNAESGAAFNAITLSVLDAMLGAPAHDWVGAYAAAVAKTQDKADEGWARHVAARAAKSRPSLPLAGYAGGYRDAWYGDVSIEQSAGTLRLRFGATADLAGTMEHWQHDTFIVRWDNRALNADAFVNFSLDPDGKVREVRMQAVSSLTDFSFDFQDLLLLPVSGSR